MVACISDAPNSLLEVGITRLSHPMPPGPEVASKGACKARRRPWGAPTAPGSVTHFLTTRDYIATFIYVIDVGTTDVPVFCHRAKCSRSRARPPADAALAGRLRQPDHHVSGRRWRLGQSRYARSP